MVLTEKVDCLSLVFFLQISLISLISKLIKLQMPDRSQVKDNSMSDKKGEDYDKTLKNAGLTTLEDCRRRGDQIQTYKAVKGISRVDSEKWFSMKDPTNMRPTRANTTMSETGPKTKSHVMNIPACRLQKNFYSVRIVNEWNGLPEETKSAKSTNHFKNLYDKTETSKE